MSFHAITLTIDGLEATATVAAEVTLADLLRLHEGCGEGVCGACTVTVDGEPVRGCLMLAVQADGAAIRTVASLADIEGVVPGDDGLTPLQRALSEHHAFQCGWCVPGLLVGTAAMLAGRTTMDEAEVHAHLVGHLCRCTAGRGVVDTIADVLAERQEARR